MDDTHQTPDQTTPPTTLVPRQVTAIHHHDSHLAINKLLTGIGLIGVGTLWGMTLIAQGAMVMASVCGIGVVALGAYVIAKWYTKRQRHLWLSRCGTLTQGTITHIAKRSKYRHFAAQTQRITFHFHDLEDNKHTKQVVRIVSANLTPGQTIPVLFDPQNPTHAISPLLLQTTFALPAPPEDQRTALSPSAQPATLTPVETTHTWPLHSHNPNHKAQAHGYTVGAIRVDPEGIQRLDKQDHVTHSIPWDNRFGLQESAHILHQGQANLSLTLRPHGTASPLTFQVQLPQSTLNKAIPLQESAQPWLDTEAFHTLWPHIYYYLQVHGRHPEGQIMLDA